MSSTHLHTLVAALSSSCHKLHSSLELLSRAPLFSTQLPHSLALSLLMYEYVRVILILYKPLSEEDEFLTLCFRPIKPKYLLRTYSPRSYSLHQSSYLVLNFRHITQSTLNQPPHLSSKCAPGYTPLPSIRVWTALCGGRKACPVRTRRIIQVTCLVTTTHPQHRDTRKPVLRRIRAGPPPHHSQTSGRLLPKGSA
jgi:hypothetical protein